jgi:hypothetical protein
LVIVFIEHLQIITASNYSTIANSHTQQFTTSRTKSSQSAVSSPVVVWQRVPNLLISQLSCSLLYWPATLSQLNFTLTLLITTWHGCIENTSPNRSSIVASHNCCTNRVEHSASQLEHWCVLGICCGHYLATGVVYRVIT